MGLDSGLDVRRPILREHPYAHVEATSVALVVHLMWSHLGSLWG